MEKDDRKKKDAEVLEQIICHLSEACKLFNDLRDRRISTFEQSQWESAIKLCEDPVEFVKGKVDSMRRRLSDDPGHKDLK